MQDDAEAFHGLMDWVSSCGFIDNEAAKANGTECIHKVSSCKQASSIMSLAAVVVNRQELDGSSAPSDHAKSANMAATMQINIQNTIRLVAMLLKYTVV